jgi:hypothetical protein
MGKIEVNKGDRVHGVRLSWGTEENSKSDTKRSKVKQTKMNVRNYSESR